MKVISICNQKGGVGKTTVAYHLGWGLYELGHPVLLVDIDPQGNLSASFKKQDSCVALEIFSDEPKLVWDVVLGDSEDTGVSLVSSNIHLAKSETTLSFTSYTKLRKALSRENQRLRKWDYILVDCPPSLGLFTVNALTASDYVVIPSLPYYYSLLGLRDLMEVLESVKEEGLNPELRLLGILINQIDRTIVARNSKDALEERFRELIFDTKIPRSIRVEEAIQNKMPIWQYEAFNPASEAFKKFTEEFLQKVEEVNK